MEPVYTKGWRRPLPRLGFALPTLTTAVLWKSRKDYGLQIKWQRKLKRFHFTLPIKPLHLYKSYMKKTSQKVRQAMVSRGRSRNPGGGSKSGAKLQRMLNTTSIRYEITCDPNRGDTEKEGWMFIFSKMVPPHTLLESPSKGFERMFPRWEPLFWKHPMDPQSVRFRALATFSCRDISSYKCKFLQSYHWSNWRRLWRKKWH